MSDQDLAKFAATINAHRNAITEAERDANDLDSDAKYERLMTLRAQFSGMLIVYFEYAERDRLERARECPVHGRARVYACGDCVLAGAA